MMKHLLYVSTTLPTPGYGSSVILYRHLKRLKDWRITILVDDDSAAARHDLPKEWQILKTAAPQWWWPPVTRRIPGLLDLRLRLSSQSLFQAKGGRFVRSSSPHVVSGDPSQRSLAGFPIETFGNDIFLDASKKEKPDAILTQFGKNSLLAAFLSKKLDVPLSVIVHDRWQVWGKLGGADRFLTDDLALSVLDQASRVWPVSEEMGRYYKGKDPKKVSVLYPVPEGREGNFASWKPEFAGRPVVAFAGSYHSPQASTLRAAAEELQNLGGELLIVTKRKDLIEKEMGRFAHVRYLDPFPANKELLTFLKENATALIISGSIDTRAAGWQLSFPSRLVEFVQTGLPVIISGTPGTALANWAEKHHWRGYLAADDHAALDGLLSQLTRYDTWAVMAEQSRVASLGEFNPERIQKQFESELALG